MTEQESFFETEQPQLRLVGGTSAEVPHRAQEGVKPVVPGNDNSEPWPLLPFPPGWYASS